jgi:hypothetical protein
VPGAVRRASQYGPYFIRDSCYFNQKLSRGWHFSTPAAAALSTPPNAITKQPADFAGGSSLVDIERMQCQRDIRQVRLS